MFSKSTLCKIREVVLHNVPVGFKRHNKEQPIVKMPGFEFGTVDELDPEFYPVVSREFKNAREFFGNSWWWKPLY